MKHISIDEIKETLEKRGYYLVDEDIISNAKIYRDRIDIYDNEGYYYQLCWSNIKKIKRPPKFHKDNKYSIKNINHFLEMNRPNYRCVSTEYINSTSPLSFIHIPCKNTFESRLEPMVSGIKVNKNIYYKHCPICQKHLKESLHASVLKQVFLKEYPDTVVEDRTCINPKTNRALPTDIVNHRLMIAIEIQSHYHDNPDRKVVDEFKKNFWINKGYRFYCPDIRNYTVLEMIQIFFPHIKVIPEYINYFYSLPPDFQRVQPMLDSGHTIKEIETTLGYNHGYIYRLLNDNRIKLPEHYQEMVFHMRPIVRLSKEGIFISRFSSKADANKHGFASGTVARVLLKKQKFAYDTCWFYEDDYLAGNYTIPQEEPHHFLLPVSKYDMNGNYIKSYDSIYEAEKDSLSDRYAIYRVAKGNRLSSKKEKWKFIN